MVDEKKYIEVGTAISSALEVLPVGALRDAVESALLDIPTADVRPVVRCCECKHHYDVNEPDGPNCMCVIDADPIEGFPDQFTGFLSYHEPNFFCAFGEKAEVSAEMREVQDGC